MSVWVGEGARWTCAVEVSRADAHVAAVRAIAWRPSYGAEEDEDADDAGNEEVKGASASCASTAGGGGAGLGLATVGADHSVRLFRVTLR